MTLGADPVYKATIVPRGQALGMVTQLPEDDRNSMTRQEMLARLVVCMGGRAAEEIIFGADHITSGRPYHGSSLGALSELELRIRHLGASSDVQAATRLASAMVKRYAMSDKVGPVLIDDEERVSAKVQDLVDSEIKALLEVTNCPVGSADLTGE